MLLKIIYFGQFLWSPFFFFKGRVYEDYSKVRDYLFWRMEKQGYI